MSIFSGPEITDAGLILSLDAGNPTSYPTSMPTQVEYLIVAGGGGGGGGQTGGLRSGGGGGGGGVLTGFTTLTNQVYNIVVGSGGSGGAPDNAGSVGQNSSAFGFTALGGGGGAGAANGVSTTGGSGGGGGGGANLESGSVGTAGQGTAGSTGVSVSPFSGGGGGGAGAPGFGAGGGGGLSSSITGTSAFYGGGGSGGNSIAGGAGGGAGGGGRGGGVLTIGTLLNVTTAEIGFVSSRYIFQIDCPAPNTSPPYTTLAAVTPGTVVTLVRGGGNVSVTVGGVTTLSLLNRVTYDPVTGYAGPNITGTQVLLPSGSSSGGSAGTAGTANTGGGGGGAGGQNATAFSGGAGGSGVVIIRYPGAQQASGGTVTTSGGFTTHTFTSSGTFGPLTWRDTSGQSNNGTLINGPTFNSANGGSLVFDGIDDFVNMPTGLSNYYSSNAITVIAWARISSVVSKNTLLSFNGAFNFFLPGNRLGPTQQLYWDPTTGWIGSANTTWAVNQWYQFAWTINASRTLTFYTNGVFDSSATIAVNFAPTSNAAVRVGFANAGEYATGNIGLVQVYNRVLTADEIDQNFQALRGRYGI